MVRLPLTLTLGWLVSIQLHRLDLRTIHIRPTTATHQVYTSDGEVWDATLNQTDLSKNANKCVFFISSREHGSNAPVTGFTYCSFCIPLAMALPPCSSHAGVVSEKLVHPNARLDVPSKLSSSLLTVTSRVHSRLPPPLLSSRSSSNPRRLPIGRAAEQWHPLNLVSPRKRCITFPSDSFPRGKYMWIGMPTTSTLRPTHS